MVMTISPARRLRGVVRVPGDKSIAHRALILGALAHGEQIIQDLPSSGDVASTANCLRTLGCRVDRRPDGWTTVRIEGWRDQQILYAGNSGTTARLLAGVIAARGLSGTIDGDESLRRRPMERVAEPLRRMGADVRTTEPGTLPMRIQGGPLTGIEHRMSVASAQVKSAILIAGLSAEGRTTVIERAPTRDHTEIMLQAMGVPLDRTGLEVSIRGGAELQGIHLTVPGDVSSAAFFIAAAAIHPDAELDLPSVGVNPTRTGALRLLQQMGVDLDIHVRAPAPGSTLGEPIADIHVRSSTLWSSEIEPSDIPTLIDELPILAVVATQARGVTTVRGAGELRHKESDRIRAIVSSLARLGADIAEREDGFVVRGPTPLRGATVSSHGDHRIAMAMAVAGLIAEGSTRIEGSEIVEISYPGFARDLSAVAGAQLL
jgi:3-phosphoshikimate 1-carboxyvinyltransferase